MYRVLILRGHRFRFLRSGSQVVVRADECFVSLSSVLQPPARRNTSSRSVNWRAISQCPPLSSPVSAPICMHSVPFRQCSPSSESRAYKPEWYPIVLRNCEPKFTTSTAIQPDCTFCSTPQQDCTFLTNQQQDRISLPACLAPLYFTKIVFNICNKIAVLISSLFYISSIVK